MPSRAWQGYFIQALVEVITKCQALKATWKGHSLKALVEPIAKCQAFKRWQILANWCIVQLCSFVRTP